MAGPPKGDKCGYGTEGNQQWETPTRQQWPQLMHYIPPPPSLEERGRAHFPVYTIHLPTSRTPADDISFILADVTTVIRLQPPHQSAGSYLSCVEKYTYILKTLMQISFRSGMCERMTHCHCRRFIFRQSASFAKRHSYTVIESTTSKSSHSIVGTCDLRYVCLQASSKHKELERRTKTIPNIAPRPSSASKKVPIHFTILPPPKPPPPLHQRQSRPMPTRRKPKKQR